MNFERSSGLLFHPTSLPSPYGIGSLGKEAYSFVDFLKKASQKLWQVFPLGPTGYGDSPYQCFSAFAGNPLLIDLDLLIEQGLLSKSAIACIELEEDKIDFGALINFKIPLLRLSFERFIEISNSVQQNKFNNFLKENHFWLHDYALFRAIKDKFGGKSWLEWDKSSKFRDSAVLAKYETELAHEINFHKYMQFQFFEQWYSLKKYANDNGIKIVGDIPIFVALDSSDAWANPELFLFDEERNPVKVAGVPPDYFSATGQLWGNPLYNWEILEKTNFEWWIKRVEMNLKVSDIVRIDHFRGFESFWAVPFGEPTAINGEWTLCPGKKLFHAIEKALGKAPIIAEDLGLITPEVEDLRDTFSFPGMKILQFAFDSKDESNHLPHTCLRNSVIYTGTHDNDTIVGWYEKASPDDKAFAKEYLNIRENEPIAWQFMRGAWASIADLALAPVQDLFEMDSSARMNTPGVASGNWQWRIKKGMLTDEVAAKLSKLTKTYFR